METEAQALAALAQRIAARRAELQLTMRDVQQLTGIHISTLSRCEQQHHRKGPRIDVLAKLAIALRLPLTDLLQPYTEFVASTLHRST